MASWSRGFRGSSSPSPCGLEFDPFASARRVIAAGECSRFCWGSSGNGAAPSDADDDGLSDAVTRDPSLLPVSASSVPLPTPRLPEAFTPLRLVAVDLVSSLASLPVASSFSPPPFPLAPASVALSFRVTPPLPSSSFLMATSVAGLELVVGGELFLLPSLVGNEELVSWSLSSRFPPRCGGSCGGSCEGSCGGSCGGSRGGSCGGSARW
mmetsp:Transcript_30197/g.87942  ORF Transcript_30197/g.87942 Transcript_30197/m.87942 type:complete len:210 (+) Transcript_30197:1341-1970(+)